MSYYSTEQKQLPQLIREAFSYYGKALKASLWFLILTVLLQNTSFFLKYLNSHQLVVIILLITGLCSVFLWSSALHAVHKSLQNEPESFLESLRAVSRRFISIVFFIAFYIAFFILMLFWMGFVNHRLFVDSSMQPVLWWLDLFLVGLPLLFFLLLFSLTIPIIIVERCNILVALRRSAKMVWLSQFKSALILYAGIILFFYLITPNTRHALWFYQHHLKVLFDLVVYVLLGPVLLSYALLLVNNLENFLQAREQRNQA